MISRRQAVSSLIATAAAPLLPPVPKAVARAEPDLKVIIDRVLAHMAEYDAKQARRHLIPYRFGKPLACLIEDRPTAASMSSISSEPLPLIGSWGQRPHSKQLTDAEK